MKWFKVNKQISPFYKFLLRMVSIIFPEVLLELKGGD